MGEEMLQTNPPVPSLDKISNLISSQLDSKVWEPGYVSKWGFEKLLDKLAIEIRNYISSAMTDLKEQDIGCSILYRNKNNYYYVGGSSSDRIYMESSSRFYRCCDQEQKDRKYKSFTVFSIINNISFVLDNFKQATENFEDIIHHEPKKCELDEQTTKSYFTMPLFSKEDNAPKVISLTDGLAEYGLKHKIIQAECPVGLVRITSSEENYASKVSKLFEPKLINALHEVINKYDEVISKQSEGSNARHLFQRNNALALADLQADLLQYKNREYIGLRQLAFHLQTLFGDCECSIFLAHPHKDLISVPAYQHPGTPQVAGSTLSRQSNIRIVALYLAATTALTTSSQHIKFLNTFIEGFVHYHCFFDENNRPISCEIENNQLKGCYIDSAGQPALIKQNGSCAKTENAYYYPNKTHIYGKGTKPSKHVGFGELKESGSFMAIAIPARDPDMFPYGVIRIVSKYIDAFDEAHERLATAIAKAMVYWLDYFPLNNRLEINWHNLEEKQKALRFLFNLSKIGKSRLQLLDKGEIELNWLLEKLFVDSRKITVMRLFSGKSGAIVLLVKNDHGRDLIVKCSNKNEKNIHTLNDPRLKSQNVIVEEIKNYNDFILGKLELNHNIIYPELIRETLHLIGFATSFFDSKNRNRVSLTDFCIQTREHPRFLEQTFTRVVDKLTTEIWEWWYQPDQIGEKLTQKPCDFSNNLIRKDPLFSFFLQQWRHG